MVEKARRAKVEYDDSESPIPQWEVFVRDEEGGPLRHVGSVAAESATDAHEQASRLFGWYSVDLWVCPADEVVRFSTRAVDDEAADPDADDDGTTDDTDDGSEEPRVYKETAGVSDVNSL
ncbi:Htur_1727 family rSAM-partnered candidate RiPP [Halopiger xanaduensis]|uniref:Phenylacetic acid degradation B n=1 Tax=Halopiger xanaduensis (strain DSM 18323 / JCM 14033 / SH-6) TaxID=797210 RepID=F8D331_HALXS|nr:Htur_1727 family rSAM-partnered candidate RiPP [Halopiger xanaduensis]AEH37315.1 phenylacetic acid degradation B [Halopiger xanaduensis SH-6]